MAIPLLLLQCDLKKIWGQTGRMLLVYLIGAVGTALGAFAAFSLVRAAYVATGGSAWDLACVTAMMTGTYIGGSVNLAAMASTYSLQGTDVTAAAVVADNLLMALYFFVLIACAASRFFRRRYDHPYIDRVEADTACREGGQTQASAFWSRKDISLKDIAVNVAFSATVVWLANIIASFVSALTPEGWGLAGEVVGKFLGSPYVWITTISVLAATFASDKVEKVHGASELGTFCIYLFLFVIGVPANVITVFTKSPLLLALCAIIVAVNMLFCFLGAKLFRCSLEDAIVASNACIGGPTTAAGMAISQGWAALVGPAMLVGVLGYVVGNYAATLVGAALGV
jgi:uncharacterized membrane protein